MKILNWFRNEKADVINLEVKNYSLVVENERLKAELNVLKTKIDSRGGDFYEDYLRKCKEYEQLKHEFDKLTGAAIDFGKFKPIPRTRRRND